jgi:hypothetical protein
MTFIWQYEFQCEDNSRRLERSPERVLNKEDGLLLLLFFFFFFFLTINEMGSKENGPCDSSLT